MPGAIVIFSGGLDSTVCLAIAKNSFDKVIAITFDYGQRHNREIDSAKKISKYYSVENKIITFNSRDWGGSALTSDTEVPESGIKNEIPVTYVPARNIIFLSFGLAVSEALDFDEIFIGVNALDYSGYPDCRPQFIDAFQKVADIGQKRGIEGNPVKISTPLIDMTKEEIVLKGRELKVPFELTWSCYKGEEKPCEVCDSCVLREKGFKEAGIKDPIL